MKDLSISVSHYLNLAFISTHFRSKINPFVVV